MVSLSFGQVVIGLSILVSAMLFGAFLGGRLGGSRPSRRDRFSPLTRRRIGFVVIGALLGTLTGDPALAVGRRVETPRLVLPSRSAISGWLRGKPTPDWGNLPQQVQGSADGRSHTATSDQTRAKGGSGHPPKPGKGELPEDKALRPKFEQGPSAPGNVGFSAKTSKRLANKSTATSDYYQNADGTFTRIMSQTPVNYRDTRGDWQPIDTNLKSTDGRITTTANGIGTDFAPSAADPRLVRLTVDGHQISYGLQGANPVAPSVTGSTATYPDALAQTDIKLEATPDGVKETLVLKAADAPAEWVFPLDVGDLRPELDPNGGILFKNARGTIVTRAPPPYAWDSKVDPRSGLPAMTNQTTYELVERDGLPALVMKLDQQWLHSPDRVFPVQVDPTYRMYSVSTYVITGWDGDHSMERYIAVGSFDNGPHTARSYLKFPDQSLDNSGVTVTGAKLRIFNVWASTCSAQQFDVFEGLEPWETWDAKMRSYATSPGYTQWLGYSFQAAVNACQNNGGSNPDPTFGDWHEVTLNASIIDGWAKGTRPNYGLVLASPVNDNAHWKQFASYNNWSNPPQLIVTYSGKLPPRLRNLAPPDGTVSSTLTPTLSATGEYDGAVTTKQIRFAVYNENSQVVVDSGNLNTTDSAASWTVPVDKLEWGKTYYWSASAWDGTTYSADATWQTLSTRVPQPVITSALSRNGGRGFDPAIGNYTTTATDAEVETVGPDLAVERDYNSRDPRISGVFGAGWSSVFDAKVTERRNAANDLLGAYVTYPDGSTVGFGRNNNGSFTPPQGRFVSFRSVTGGYTLTDKNGTEYKFTQSLGGGRYGITSITDASTLAVNFTWTSGRITKMTSAASGRSLYLNWVTPPGAANSHVSQVSTDPATPGNANTAQTWDYTYDGDRLTKVCALGCTQYSYISGSNYHSQVLDQGAESFWPFSESSGTIANSANPVNQGADKAFYSNVTLGVPGPLAGGSATAADFNGTSSAVQLPRTYKIGTKRPQAISLWFKGTTSNGVLFSYSLDNPQTSSTAPSDYTPALYVGSDGKLYGSFFTNNTADQYTPINSPAAVTDGNWHNVVLTGDGGTQWLYLDGVLLGSKTGLHEVPGQWVDTVGAGYFGYKWPSQPQYSTTSKTGYAAFFKGAIADVAYFDRTLGQNDVTDLYTVAKTPTAYLNSITRPSGKPFAAVSYDSVTGTVTHVTDENGGGWNIDPAQVYGSSKVYRSAVLGSGPATYFRFADLAGSANATDEINAGPATYVNVNLGVGGPFPDASAAAFNGTSSYVEMPVNNQVQTRPGSVEMWFTMPADNTNGGVLFGEQNESLAGATGATSGYVPALYVGTDGKVHGKFWDANGTGSGLTSKAKVNDGKWHHVALSTTGNSQTLYLDGVPQGTINATLATTPVNYVYIGAGMAGGTWPHHPVNTLGYFPGSISDVAFYRGALGGQDVSAHYGAAGRATGTTPLKSITVRDPAAKPTTYEYDLLNGGRLIGEVDDRGGRTTYGYDTGGYPHTVTDPNKNVVVTGHDVRGNTVSRTTCQNQAADKCSTTYYSYFPDATSTQLTPNPKNDLLLTIRDGRSSGPTDDTFLTVYEYDATGNRTGVVTSPVPGFPAGRKTTTSYTDGTTVAAADGGFAPRGLPYKTVTPSGATTQISYFKNGDIASVTDAAGMVTRGTYDGLGRLLTSTAVSDAYPAGLTKTLSYDEVGNVVQIVEPPVTNRVTGAVHTAKTTTVYDSDGNMTSQTTEDTTGGDAPRTSSATYNSHGQVATSTDALGNITTYEYDGYGNTVTETDPYGQKTAYTYDADGRMLTTTLKGYIGDPNNPSTARDLITESRAYDPAGRLASVTDAMGYAEKYEYTDDGLTAKVTQVDANGQSPYVQSELTYDAAGNVTKEVTNNGATTVQSTRDTAGRVVSTTLDPSGVNRKTTVSYTPDDLVATSTKTDTGQWTYTTSFTYDQAGRKTSESITGDDPNHPVAWWKLDQTSGKTIHDATGDGFTAAAGAGVSWNDSAAVLNGSTGAQITTNGPVVDTSQSFTVSAWVKPTVLTGTQTFVSQDGNRQSGFFLKYEGNNGKWSFMRVGSDADSPSSFHSAYGTTAPAVGTWAHLVGTFNSTDGTMTLYVDGQAQSTATAASSWNATGPLVIGRAKYSGNLVDYANASISNVQVYNRVLSGTEVTRLFTNGRTGGTAASSSKTTVRWAYDQRGLPTSVTDPNGNATNYGYDEAGRQVIETGPTVNVETDGGAPVAQHPVELTGYDTSGAVTETQDARGNTTVIAYDAEGQKTKVTQPSYTAPGASAPTASVSMWVYDKTGQVTDTTDGLGNTTHLTYDQLGNVASAQDSEGGTTTTVYDVGGEAIATTSPSGARTQATYDHLGRPLTTTVLDRYPTATTATTTYSYTASATNPGGAYLASVGSPRGETTAYGYNAVGEQTSVTDPAGAVTGTGYDMHGRPVKVTLADGTSTQISYDHLDNITSNKQVDTDGTTILQQTSAAYDAAGRQISVTDGRGITTTFTRDADGLITSQTEQVWSNQSIITSYGYDADGNRTRFTDGRGNAWIYGYNSWGLLESTLEPSTAAYNTIADRKTTVVYDAVGQPVSETKPGGVTITNTYDGLGRVTGISGTGADAVTAAKSYTYDGDGRILTAETAAVTGRAATDETFTYNDRGLLLTATGSAGASSFVYDVNGAMTQRTDAAGTTTYGYDSAARLSTIDDPATGTRLTSDYDAMSRLTSIAYGTSKTRAFTYDKLSRLKTDTLKDSGSTTIASITYGYDGNSNLTSKTTTGVAGASTNTYTYDRANRLDTWNNGTTTVDYDYDASGNRTRVGADVYTYDARNQLTSDGARTYTYSARGTLKTQVEAGVTSTYTSDAFGQQVTEAAASGGGTQTYLTDALGRVITATGPSAFTFAYSGQGNTVASDGATTYTRSVDGSLIGIGQSGGGVLALTDLHTDVVANFTTGSTGLTGSTTYDPLGAVKSTTGMVGNLGYQSGWTDPATKKVNMSARWYSPAVGQFQNKDTVSLSPIPTSVTANPFAYGDDNPLTVTDPTGHWPCLSCAWNKAKNAGKALWEKFKQTHSGSGSGDGIILKPEQSKPKPAPKPKTRKKNNNTFDGPVPPLMKKKAAPPTRSAKSKKPATSKPVAKAQKKLTSKTKSGPTGKPKGTSSNKPKPAARPAPGKPKKPHWSESASEHATNVIVGITDPFVDIAKSIPVLAESVATSPGGTALQMTYGSVSDCAASGGSDVEACAFAQMDMLLPGTGEIARGFFETAKGIWDQFASGHADRGTGQIIGNLLLLLGTGGRGAPAKAAAPGLRSEVKVLGTEGSTVARPSLRERLRQLGSTCFSPHSFIGATLVAMADGTAKRIDRIKRGDKVLTATPDGKHEAHTVARVIVTKTDHDFITLTLATRDAEGTPSSTSKITTTRHHPFYNITRSSFTDAADLAPGDRLQQSNGHPATILEATPHLAFQTTYDLTITGLHTYYVLAGNTPVLVHNDSCPVSGLSHGDLGELASFDRLQAEGYTDILSEPQFMNHLGQNFRGDFIARAPDGRIVVVDAKTGRGSVVSFNQKVGYSDLMSNQGAIVDTSRLEKAFGLKSGQRVTFSVEFDLWTCPFCGSAP